MRDVENETITLNMWKSILNWAISVINLIVMAYVNVKAMYSPCELNITHLWVIAAFTDA